MYGRSWRSDGGSQIEILNGPSASDEQAWRRADEADRDVK